MSLIWLSALAHGAVAVATWWVSGAPVPEDSSVGHLVSFFLVVLGALLFGGFMGWLLRRHLRHLTSTVDTASTQQLRNWPELPATALPELVELNRALGEMHSRGQAVVQGLALDRTRHREILDSVTEAILITNAEGRITLSNRAFTGLFGASGDFRGKRPVEVVRNEAIAEAIDEVITGQKFLSHEVSLPGAKTRYLDVQVAPIVEADRFEGTITVLYEITRLRRLERIRADFVANVSHELRTPLTAIRGCAETLTDGAINDPEMAARFAGVISTHAERLTILLDDLLDLSRLESEELQVEFQAHAMHQIADSARAAVEEARAEKQIQVEVRVEDAVQVRVDRQLIEQALINLMDNAIKYTREGGQVRVRIHEVPGGQVEDELASHTSSLGAFNQSGEDPGQPAVVFVEVTDSGIGIPSDQLDRVFERFYRVDKGRSRQMGGTGLGLSIVRHTINLHGERVFVDSELDRGSTFGFTLPVA